MGRGDLPWSDGELWRRAGADRLLFEPGQGWAYSNVGYLLVRRLIEETAGEDIGAALHRMVCVPLGVPGARLARDPHDLSTTAWGNAAGYHPGWVYHGLLIGTPAEAARFLDGLLTGRLLGPAQIEAMLESRSVGGVQEGRPWRTPAYGLGLMTDVVPPRGRSIGHSGAGPGSVAAAYHFPDLDPPRTFAAFALGGDVGIVERAALELP